MRTIYFAIAVLFAITSVHARICETMDECIERYGKPVGENADKHSLDFQKNGLLVTAVFMGSSFTCSKIQFVKLSAKPFTVNEIAAILDANKWIFKWQPAKAKAGKVISFTSKDELMAVVSEGAMSIEISDERVAKIEKDQQSRIDAANAARTLNGL